MKKILLLPFLVFVIIAFINLIFGLALGFITWIILAILVALIFFPIAMNTADKEVPIIQLFTSLIFIYIFFSIAAFLDFKNLLGYPTDQALVFGFLSGFAIIAIIMMLKGK
jgi:hypothetical protein